MAPKQPQKPKGKGRASARPEDSSSTPAEQPDSASQAEEAPPEQEAMIVDDVDDSATDGATPSAVASGKRKERPPSMEDLDLQLILTRDGGISHPETSCDQCRAFRDHMRRSHASEKHAALRRVYNERNSARVLQEEYDRGRAEERDRALDAIKERDAEYNSTCDELDRVRSELSRLREDLAANPSPLLPDFGSSRSLSRRSSKRNLRVPPSTESLPGSGVADAVPAPPAEAPLADHVAYFRQRPKTQPPWLVAALARAGESVGGVDEDAVWKHSYATGAISGWLALRRLIGVVARGNFKLTPAVLGERVVPLLGNPQSGGEYVAYVKERIPTFDGRRPTDFAFWRTSLRDVVQLEQLTSAFLGQIMLHAPLSPGEAYGVVTYSRFVREAEARRLTLIPSDATPASWGDDDLGDMRPSIAPPPLAAIRPPPPSSTTSRPATSRRGGATYPMAPPPPPSTTSLSTRASSRAPSRTSSRASSPQRSAASSSFATTPLPGPSGAPPTFGRVSGPVDWAGFSSTQSSRNASSSGLASSPYARERGSSVAPSFVSEDTIIDDDDAGLVESYVAPSSREGNEDRRDDDADDLYD
jgi:hypothetical protein